MNFAYLALVCGGIVCELCCLVGMRIRNASNNIFGVQGPTVLIVGHVRLFLIV